jgi:hypothetical protein
MRTQSLSIYKYYPVVVTNKMDDGAQVMVMRSAKQKGTTSKPQLVQDRSAYVIREGSRPKFNNSHQLPFEVDCISGCNPAPGKFINPLNKTKTDFDSAFLASGYLTDESTADLVEWDFQTTLRESMKNLPGGEIRLRRILNTRNANGQNRWDGSAVVSKRTAVSMNITSALEIVLTLRIGDTPYIQFHHNYA